MLVRKAYVYFQIHLFINPSVIQSFQHFNYRDYFVPERVKKLYKTVTNFVPVNFGKYFVDVCIVNMPTRNKACIIAQFQNKEFSNFFVYIYPLKDYK